MKKLKLLLIAAFVVLVAGAGSYFLLKSKPGQNKPVVVAPDKFFGWKFPIVKFPLVGPEPTQVAYSDIRDPGGVPQGLPVRLKIPTIGVDAAIEDALITIDGRMDVPSGSVNVAWFALGPHPGQEGSAVIGGHFGINNGVKFVFYDLDKLKIGDKISIVDDEYKTLVFVVQAIKLFNRNADATDVFTSHDGLAHLNLITCEGVWNQTNGTYPERRVVFADLVSEGVVPASIVPRRTLSVGDRGADVLELQTLLEHKGFLVMPQGAVKGYFGTVTRAAVIKYQTSVGLPKDGVLGALTRARLFGDLAVKPALPATYIIPPETNVTSTPSFIRIFAQSVKSLFTTPLDALITSLLLILIFVVSFKIIRR